jgi:Tol biopolymer transport system component
MKRPRSRPRITLLSTALAIALSCPGCGPANTVPQDYLDTRAPARISPDYSDAVIPPNIAPLNFVVKEEAAEYRVRIHADRGEEIIVSSSTAKIQIPLDSWNSLLSANRGKALYFDIYARGEDGSWSRFDTIANRIAEEEIDPYLFYRLFQALYSTYEKMGTYQRNLENFDESPVILSQPGTGRCVNCHTFVNNNPDKMLLHLRGPDGFRAPAAYSSWHPSGELIAFSVNAVVPFHHTARAETRDVFDFTSDVGLFLFGSNSVVTTDAIADPAYLETFPSWSPDGRHLYFSRTRKTWLTDRKGDPIPPHYKDIRYDLMRIGYDVDTGEWGTLEMVLSSETTGMSLTEPRISPDGRFLIITMHEYGNFAPYLRGSDLYMLELETGLYWRMVCNSDEAEAWHSWSTNSRWIVFSSKRRDGMLAKPYFSYVDEHGKSRKPLLLPQEDPTYYDSLMKTYNLPELATGPVNASQREILAGIRSEAIRAAGFENEQGSEGGPPAHGQYPGFE